MKLSLVRVTVALTLLLFQAATSVHGADEVSLPPDTEGAPLPPAEALKRVTVPEGFKVTLFAHEPDIRQPIAMTFDDRGRLWVCECYSYPDFKVKNRDRVVILEDTDHDGRHDKRTIFWDRGNSLTGIEYGYGGIWVSCAPHLLFIADKNGDDVPDGQPEVVLDGWTTDAQHNVFNGLKWGPDGWLYGCHGILATSRVGRPGTPDDKRVPLNCGIWRFHPTRKTFEVVAHGTTNPWGIDFNEYGEGFFTNCVIDHVFHLVPGAHYKRMFGQDMNPYVYELMDAASDHLHWGGGHWTESRTGQQHDEPGGGHAHSGTLIYLGDNFPKAYYGTLFTCNIHGNRVNNDALARKGSGWVATHRPDFFKANDPWFRGVALAMGPDGGMYIADWSDTGECHDYKEVHRGSGRIYKVVYGQPKTLSIDLSRLPNKELADLQSSNQEWNARHARRILAERAARGDEMKTVTARMREMLNNGNSTFHVIRALWVLQSIGELTESSAMVGLRHQDAIVRGWTFKLLFDFGDVERSRKFALDLLSKSYEFALDDNPILQRYVAETLKHVSFNWRAQIVASMVSGEDREPDRFLDLLLWFAVEPTVPDDPEGSLIIAEASETDLLRKLIVRRLCEPDLRKANLPRVIAAIGQTDSVKSLRILDNPRAQAAMLEGMSEAFRGLKNQPLPEGWQQLTAKVAANGDAKSQELSRTLSLIFGDPAALEQLRATLVNAKAKSADRIAAIELLSERKTEGLAPQLIKLLDEPQLRIAVLRGLSAYDDAAIPGEIINRYSKWDELERIEAINTLASRASYAKALVAAIEAKTIPAQDVSPFHARQLAALKNREIDERLAKVWGRIKPANEERQKLKEQFKARLTDDVIAVADARSGRVVFNRMCGACHSLFGEGAKIGPELTGAQRANLDYVLENLIDPNALIGKNYQMTIVTLADGRVVSGVIDAQNEATLTLKTTSGKATIPRDDIEELVTSEVSMMPEGQLDKLSFEELRDLVAYLRSPQQVPLPEGASVPRQ